MKSYFKNSIEKIAIVPKILLILMLSMLSATPAFAHLSPIGCTGSGLGINLFTNLPQVNIGDVISYSVFVFNGAGGGPVVCDADNIQASVVTPDGVNHPIALTRTALSNGQFDNYLNVVTYTARAQDITAQGTLVATASDTGVIHQNITDSQGGANQGLNVYVLNTLHVIKQVVNNTIGTATSASFNIHVKTSGLDVSGSPSPGVGVLGTLYSLIAGTYTVSEDANISYTPTFSGDCDASGNVSLLAGDNKTCTITNTDIPAATINVVKTVVNDNGRTRTVADFPLFVNGTPVVSGVTNVFPAPASYVVTETNDPNYTRTFSGDCDANGNVSLVPGDNKVCTITNNDIAIPPLPATINVVKTVVNDDGRTRTVADFPLFVNGTPVVSGVTNVFPAPASYLVTETNDPNYTRTFSGDCDANGNVSLVPGDNKFCIITNDDLAIAPIIVTPPGGGGLNPTPIPPLIDVVKVPTPLALPGGPGQVTYTYTLRNVGTVPVTNITMVGDTCSPIILLSGDINGDARLDLNEIWIYGCSTTLTATHTNTVVATGWANGISAVDIASATVVVGAPGFPNTGIVVPPLIHVTKLPNPLALFFGGGMVTYTEIVTNPGTVPLSNVFLTDDKCSPVNYISGDVNGDSRLDTSENWIYTCATNLTKTTTNTAIASGEANGFQARDFAVATVVVRIPRLPNTGFPPEEKSAPWKVIIPAGISLLVFSFYLSRKKLVI